MILDQIRLLIRKGDELKKIGQYSEAVIYYKKAINSKPSLLSCGLPFFKVISKEIARAYNSLGQLYCCQNELNEMVCAYLNATTCDPQNHAYWIHFARSLHLITFTQKNASIKEAILFCLKQENINPQHLAFAGTSLLKLDPLFYSLHSIAIEGDVNLMARYLTDLNVQEFLQDPLFLALLCNTIIPDAQIEFLLTFLRRTYLLSFHLSSTHTFAEKTLPFLEALADQCEMNEYVYFVSEEEKEYLKNLDIQSALQFTLRRSYQSPIEETAKEPSALHTQNLISQKVQRQYEENPYPRWKRVDYEESKSFKDSLEEIYPYLSLQKAGWPSHSRILIAGCGTGFHAISSAIQFKNSTVLALDLSASSLAYAKQKATQMKITNIEFIQKDILDLEAGFSEKFDIIECSGVLHHMQNPIKGWEVLRKLLKPTAWMFIGLYSSWARQDVFAARKFIAENHYPSTIEGIRWCRQAFLKLPVENILHRVTESVDFYSTSSSRDLLFNVHEVNFTLPEIDKALKKLHLDFIGFCFSHSKIVLDYMRMFPSDPEMKSLNNWHRFELQHPNTFMGMYQFWVKTPG